MTSVTPGRKAAGKIVRAIISDLSDRRGLRQEWEAIDRDVQREIIAAWTGIVEAGLESQEHKL